MKKYSVNQSVGFTLPGWIVAAAGCIFLSTSTAFAADTSQSSSDQTQVKPKKPGFYTDSFHILPELQVTAYYDDNIYATRQATESDYVAVVSPSLKISSRWDRHNLKLNTGANFGRYLDNSDEDYEDFWFETSGKYVFNENVSLFGGAGYNKKHEGRDSKESNQSVDRPTTYDVLSAQLGGRYNRGEYVVRLGMTYEQLDFDNVGDLFNDDRDRTHTGAGIRVTRRFDRQTRFFVQGLFNNRDYDIQPSYEDDTDPNNVTRLEYPRDSKGYTADVGMIRTFGAKDRLEAYIGMLSQDYDYSGFSTVTEPHFGVNLRWYPTESYKFTGKLNRVLSETTEELSSGYLYTSLDLQLEKKMFTDYVGYVSYGYGEADYQEISREDESHSFGLGLNYYRSPHVVFSASYSHINNDSNDRDYDYKRNLLLFSVKAKLAP